MIDTRNKVEYVIPGSTYEDGGVGTFEVYPWRRSDPS